MGWKAFLAAGCVVPPLAGCNIYYYAARNILNEPTTLVEQICRTHDLRSEARAAWVEVREQYPRCMFTEEFRDGFVEGFSDYLDRGGNALPPVVAPKRFSRNRYLTPEGQPLIQDWFLGHQYGVDVALATGQRKANVVPVLLPVRNTGSPTFNVQRPVTALPAAEPLPTPKPVEPAPASTRAADVPATAVGRGPTAAPPSPDAPVSTAAPEDSKFPAVESEAPAEAPARPPAMFIPLPAPPTGVPVLPEGVPTPSVLDDLPVLPPDHSIPKPRPLP